MIEFTAEHWSDKDWAVFHQSEGAYLASKSRIYMFGPFNRVNYQKLAADHYARARKHMGVEEC